ncbi:MAG: 4-(cytidine 5'-diphospho)-2-C-methyl-D-erythritol kinase [Rhodanobacteraceae bacterium]
MKAAGWSAWPAPAKLNLFLHILGRRTDGYHLLQTCYQILDWGDRIHLRVREDGLLRHQNLPAAINAEEELCLRAAAALRAASGCELGVDIAIDKNIPVGAGLGGGSSDAATTLVALNLLWGLGLDIRSLSRIALDLGADVPVFVGGRSAWAEGIGEVLVPMDLAPRWYLLIDAGVKVATGELFMAPELTRNAAALTISSFLSGASTVNVFEPVVCGRFPKVAHSLDWLRMHGEARLSGSGGSVFMPLGSRTEGDSLMARCPPEWRCHVVRGVARSPLLDQCDAWMQQAVSDGASPSW